MSLQMEGIFCTNAENTQQEHVRDQLNKGIVSDDIDLHCLACLIKRRSRWFSGSRMNGETHSSFPQFGLYYNHWMPKFDLIQGIPSLVLVWRTVGWEEAALSYEKFNSVLKSSPVERINPLQHSTK